MTSQHEHTERLRYVNLQVMAKRFFDFWVAIMILIIFSPLLLFIAISVRVQLGFPVLFVQIRPGLYGKPFSMFKFRTMTSERDAADNLLPDAKRLTSFGRFLRSWSLDELPELWNVVRGDMSLVGPRPLLMEYLPLYSARQFSRHNTRPGITGWAQLNGRNLISWEEKFDLDVWYVKNKSFWLDFKILILTIGKVFRREGISAEGEATMPLFYGTKI
jgi:sugar transferase EpsL